MNTLDDLARKYGTDKSSANGHHGYCDIYETYVGDRRHSPISLLELGIQEGFSLQMWAEYFDHPDARICGIDNGAHGIDPLQVPALGDGRVEAHCIGQNDPKLAELFAGRQFDIIVDDCSHNPDLTIASFRLLWPFVAPGGYYIVEDLLPQRQAWAFLENAGAVFEKSVNDRICFIRREV